MKALVKKFVKDEKGLETVEYAIIAGLIVVGTIATIVSIGGWVNAKFNALDTGLAGGAGYNRFMLRRNGRNYIGYNKIYNTKAGKNCYDKRVCNSLYIHAVPCRPQNAIYR